MSRSSTTTRRLLFATALAAFGCGDPAPDLPQVSAPRHLQPYPNPFAPDDPLWAPQPRRENPLEVVAHPSGDRAYVTLQGSVDSPGSHVVVVDLSGPTVRGRIQVGVGPTGLAMHPGGRWLVVANRFSNHVSVIDTNTDEVVHSPAADFYSIELAFTPNGQQLFITNRWRDAVAVWWVEATDDGLLIHERREPGVPVGANPRDLAVSPDGTLVAVAALTGLTVSLIDTASLEEVRRVDLRAPPNGLAFASDEHLVVATLSASTHHPPFAGPDTNEDGQPGDGTPNVNFQDLQNDIAVLRVPDGEELFRYTSDSICCRDYRDVAPGDTARHGDLLPPDSDWIVAGSLPEQVAVAADGAVYVTYSASNQVQAFAIDSASGALAPGAIWKTGHNPHGVAVVGGWLVVANRLGETVSVLDRTTGASQGEPVVGDVSGGPFPATDAEIGELFNHVTAPFTVDGDQSCAHCHREGGNIDKAFSMPLTRYGGLGLRMTMSYRGAADTRPWFFESGMDETNFQPVMNEFARIENFCCTDYTLWSDGPPTDCETKPPPECTAEPNAGSPDGFAAARGGAVTGPPQPRPTAAPSRDAFYLQVAAEVIGRDKSFGDGLYFEDPITEARTPVPLDFKGITRALGLFLLTEPRLLPNPNPMTASARRGKALFESATTACSTCHPAPAFTVSTDHNPSGLPLAMGPVVSPLRADDGTNLDLPADGFVSIFPTVALETCVEVCGAEACAADPNTCDALRNVRFGAAPLRGIWDRAASMLHDGRARGLLEVLATPGHPALGPEQRGFNESGGILDTHGATSHLSPEELDDVIRYLLTL